MSVLSANQNCQNILLISISYDSLIVNGGFSLLLNCTRVTADWLIGTGSLVATGWKKILHTFLFFQQAHTAETDKHLTFYRTEIDKSCFTICDKKITAISNTTSDLMEQWIVHNVNLRQVLLEDEQIWIFVGIAHWNPKH